MKFNLGIFLAITNVFINTELEKLEKKKSYNVSNGSVKLLATIS